MKKKILKGIELEKISGGNLKKFNRGLEYTTAGVSLAAGIAGVGLEIYNEIDRIKHPRKNNNKWPDLTKCFEYLARCVGAIAAVVMIDSARRIVSQAKDLY